MDLNIVKSQRCFSGLQHFVTHESHTIKANMRFAVFVPDVAAQKPLPVLWFLSGLTCTEENFVVKSGIQRLACAYEVIVVSPDTSPRGTNTPGEDEDYALGTGASFYVDATQAPWQAHYHMHSYISQELPTLIKQHFPIDATKQGITGFSMGGHGALIMALRYPTLFRSVSAIAPIVAPSQCPWGENAYNAYLGANRVAWRAYDSCALLADGHRVAHIRVDQGSEDEFLSSQLHPELLQNACAAADVTLDYHLHKGFDHSFYFVASIIEAHLAYHRQCWSQHD